MNKTSQVAVAKARRFVDAHYPNATVAFLGGSWAEGRAHPDSDLDIVIVDNSQSDISFQGDKFEDVIVEAAVLPESLAENFFQNSAKHRSAPIPMQVKKGLVVKGSLEAAETLRRKAESTLNRGPAPLMRDELDELCYELTLLRQDILHAAPESIIGLAVLAHVKLSQAFVDLAGVWRGDRKALRRAVTKIDGDFAKRLDNALLQACNGDHQLMISIIEEILPQVGGPKQTYAKFTV